MASLIEDYALIGDTITSALVDKNGSIDWWCVPHIDSSAAFAALLGHPEHGRWMIRPAAEIVAVRRRYLEDTLVLETEFETADGVVAVTDFMLPGNEDPVIFRAVEGRRGRVEMEMELIVRFDYGSIVPWVRRTGDGLTMVAGTDALRFHSPVPLRGEDHRTEADFVLTEGHGYRFSLAWYPSWDEAPMPLDGRAALYRTITWWRDWMKSLNHEGVLREQIARSLITIKALTYSRTGAIVAAATTSLPEQIGGERNWDYRYSWLRDASLTLQAVITAGFDAEAAAWADWLRRAVAGSPGDFQIMYSVAGGRRLTEIELDWLPGYEGSAPVRIGNAASDQFQLDVYGEVLDAALTAAKAGLPSLTSGSNELLAPTMEHLDRVWPHPDEGIWEIRGPRRQFVHSKVMAWVAYDRAIQLAHLQRSQHHPIAHWEATRDQIHTQVMEMGWSPSRNSFVQYYGSEEVDASLLMLARVGFLPPDHPRIVGTVKAIVDDLLVDGFVQRYRTSTNNVDGLSGGEGTFLMTTFWLADNYALMGRIDEAQAIFDRLVGLCNDVGLLSEEYDPKEERMLGNFPQAFSHLALIITAMQLSMAEKTPLEHRTETSASSGSSTSADGDQPNRSAPQT